MLETNCPNCGGTLLDSGKCPYCGTIVRYENELSLDISEYGYIEPITMKLMIKKGDTVYIVPLKGTINSITQSYDTICADVQYGNSVKHFNNNSVKYEILFEGHVIKNDKL